MMETAVTAVTVVTVTVTVATEREEHAMAEENASAEIESGATVRVAVFVAAVLWSEGQVKSAGCKGDVTVRTGAGEVQPVLRAGTETATEEGEWTATETAATIEHALVREG